MDWRGELDRLRRFGRQVLAVVVGLVLLVAIVVGLAYAYFAFHFTMIEPLKSDETARTVAVLVALDMYETAVGAPFAPCEGTGYRPDNRECYRLHLQGGRYCRWWKLERCEPYRVSDLALSDPDKFGRMMDAILHPCPHLFRAKYAESFLNDYCRSGAFPYSPVAIMFKGKDREVTIRID